MKICFLAGADSIHSYRWVKYFGDRGHHIDWISLVPTIFSPIANVNLHEMDIGSGPFWKKILRVAGAIAKVRRLIKKINPDILHLHYAGTNGLIGILSGFRPIIVTAWGSDVLFAGKQGITKNIVKYILTQADLVTCDAEHMRNAILEFGVNSQKISLIYFGTDTQRFMPGEKSAEIRNKLRVFEAPMIISLRNLEPVYDIETLIRAVPLVIIKYPDAKFVIAGKGSQEQKLRRMVNSLEISNNVEFVGAIQNNELPQYLRTSDIYVSTSLSDAGLSASTAEAMACETPVVVTNSGENDLWINNGESGFLVDVRNPEKLAEKINYLIGNDHERDIIGRNGREVIVEKNDYNKEMGRMETIYRRMSSNYSIGLNR